MGTLDAILLGLLQGLTEFLPVSSSGHLVILGNILGANVENTTFAILVHAATVLATITVFWGEILHLLRGGLQFKINPESKYLLKIVISMIPVMIVGLFFKDSVEALFGNGIRFVGCMLFVTAALLLLTHFIKPKKTRNITAKDAFIIGVAQAVAVIPGISRSGSTIATGMLLGDDKTQLAKFSFLMVLVPILGEAFLELLKGEFSPASSGISGYALTAGFLAAYLSGLFACKVMIRIVSRGKLWWFALYCAVAGTVTVCLG
ncbi:MAG TPA: undecaprenyl-diphosphate phosphatase [Candidatus Rikenella faecigallinarum]|uniref:Undecaprenyl-diphosphatase n=1 Tax=Candidatus Rikenella faecigallinarum TaxID=2838745 RepID=A0A9D1QCI6_9BACT|nr:undecaprenyl-diphosphate phosphatase [Candidatus Rikenella faecigallinarum]